MPLCDANYAFDGLEKMFRKNVQEACANPMSGAGSRDRHSLILKYNYFLNSLDLSLSSEATPNETLTSQYKDLIAFVQGLNSEERSQIQRNNQDWDTSRRRNLMDRCKERGLL